MSRIGVVLRFVLRFVLKFVLMFLLSVCLAVTAWASECERLSEVCLDGPSTKTISGYPVHRDCWKYEARYTCLSGALDTSECDELRDRGCGQISSKCVTNSDTGCSYYENLFQCVVTPAETSTVADCGTQTFCLDGNCFDAGHADDADFAQVVTAMEALREAGMYLDEDALTLFNGRAGKCSHKLFGLVNCCKAKSGGAPTNAQAFTAIAEAAGMGYDYARSTYMYDALFNSDAADWVMKGLYGADAGLSANPSFSYYGFTGTFNAASLSSSAITLLDTGDFVVAFDPVSFAVGIAIQFVLDALLSCDESDQRVAMRKSNKLCHYLGSYCSSKFLGACVTKKESYCCFNSRLARIINEEGRNQIGKSWGGAKSPDCSGFTPEQLQSLDFGQMDLTEFYAEIQATSLDTSAISTAIQNRIVSDPTRGYYPANP
ncbi:MAG: conjugal transfer protein TraN [Pseudomonadota bacterium]